MKSSLSDGNSQPESRRRPFSVSPLSLQIGVAGGLTEPIIERNTPVPIEQTRVFTTFKDHQQAVTIRIHQGESREASENELLGQFEFTGFHSALWVANGGGLKIENFSRYAVDVADINFVIGHLHDG